MAKALGCSPRTNGGQEERKEDRQTDKQAARQVDDVRE